MASGHSHTIWREGTNFWNLWERAFNFNFVFNGNLHINAILTSIPTLLRGGLQASPQRFVNVAFSSTLSLCRLVGENPDAANSIDNLALGRSLSALHSLLSPLSVQVNCENLAAVALSNALGGEATQNTFSNAAVMKAISVSSANFSPALLLYLSQLSEAYCSSQMMFYVVNSIKNAISEYYTCFKNDKMSVTPSQSPVPPVPAVATAASVAVPTATTAAAVTIPPPQKRVSMSSVPEPESITDSDTEAKMIISSVAIFLSKAEGFTFQRNVNKKSIL